MGWFTSILEFLKEIFGQVDRAEKKADAKSDQLDKDIAADGKVPRRPAGK